MNEFLAAVKEGLSQKPKTIPSRFFYDAKGDKLFRRIMQMEEYYLPGCEMEIIETHSRQLAKDISASAVGLQLVELGAGDGTKTRHLLAGFKAEFESMEYVAMDISDHVLEINRKEVLEEMPELNYRFVAGNYFDTYKKLGAATSCRMVLFLGANIGNYPLQKAIDFFEFVKSGLKKDDYFLVAFDMVKHPRKIIRAYDDPKGITRAFNLNLLERMNRELGADFDLSAFEHFPFYNPVTGVTSSQIVSLKAQEVHLLDGTTFQFEAFEPIHTEVSKKFFPSDIEDIALKTGMPISKWYFDQNKDYAFVLFKAVS